MITDQVQNTLAVQNLDLQTYMLLYVPAIDWIMQCIAYNASEVSAAKLTATYLYIVTTVSLLVEHFWEKGEGMMFMNLYKKVVICE